MTKKVTNERGPLLSIRRLMPAWLGRVCTVTYNNVVGALPFGVKYRLIGKSLRTKRAPYRFLKPTDTVLQIGSARDILHSGRSRAINLSMFIPQGRLIVVEADTENQVALQRLIDKENLSNITLVSMGAWDKKTTIEFWSNPSHPASNLVSEANDVIPQPVNQSKYIKYEIEVDTVDNILEELGADTPKVICVTTNGSEPNIMRGMEKTLNKGVAYLSLAPTGKDYIPLAEEMGYEYFAEDDRGYFFRRVDMQMA